MAEVGVSLIKGEIAPLPPVCMRCGAAADGIHDRHLRWLPWWIGFLLLLPGNGLWILLAYFCFRRHLRIRAPLCVRHRGHWADRNLIAIFGMLAGGLTWLILFLFNVEALIGGREAERWSVLIGYVLGGWLITWTFVRGRIIRIAGIDAHRVVLTGVAKEFAEAVGKPVTCFRCGYDLAGNVSGGCPECGTAMKR